jgi:sulfopyruvate decarboxylase subunit alpha
MNPSVANDLVKVLEAAKVSVASSVPDNWITPVIQGLDSSPSVRHAPAAREEDALGICLGAALSGVRACCLMQSVGALNCGGALSTLAVSYGVPLLMLISDRGHLGDVTIAHFQKGRAFRPFLQALNIPYYDLRPDFVACEQIENAYKMAEIGQSPVALLITKASWEAGS